MERTFFWTSPPFARRGRYVGLALPCNFCVRLALGIGVVLLCTAASAWAQSSWPEVSLSPNRRPHLMVRGPGGYLHWPKLLGLWLMFLLWVKTTDWVNQDCRVVKLPYTIWNAVVFFPFFAGLFLFGFVLPLPILAQSLAALSLFVPLLVYVIKRNSLVDPHERVMTPDHIRYLLSVGLGKLGVNMSAEKKAAHEKGAPVVFTPMGAQTEQLNQANIIEARSAPGFLDAKELVADAHDKRAEKAMLDFNAEGANVRYQIDGVWHDIDSRDRETVDGMLAVYKKIAALDVNERRKRQEGKFLADYNEQKILNSFVSQGTKTGERFIMHMISPQSGLSTLSEIGMRDKIQERLKDILQIDNGMILFSAMPGGGLSTTLSVALNSTDRYLRDFGALQVAENPEPLTDNIDISTYSTDEEPVKVLTTLMRKEPEVIAVPVLPDGPTTKLLCERAATNKLVICSIRAKEAVEALLRVLLLKVPSQDFANAITAVVNQRLIRKLCETCKEAYVPQPALLQKLGIPKGRLESLYRPPENPEKVCPDCDGIGYKDRTSIFELMVVDNAMRQALTKQPKLEVLRQLSRKAGNRGLQEEGIVLVAKGTTSLPELMRVLKQ